MSSSFRSERISRHETRKSPLARGIQFFTIGIFVIAAFLFILVRNTGSIEIVPKQYIIDKGASVLSLNSGLRWEVSPWRYSLWVRFFAPADITLLAGEYEAMRGTTIETFLTKTIKTPVHTDITITILPGWNMYDIDAYLSDKNIIVT